MTTTALDRAYSKAQRLERELREARAALAEAWEEGSRAGWSDRTLSIMAALLVLPEPDPTPNPYYVDGDDVA